MTRENAHLGRRAVLRTIGGGVAVGSVLGGIPGSVAARRGALYNLQFNSDDDAAMFTPSSPGWTPDRAAPEEWTRVTGQPYNNVVKKNIDENGTTSGFSRWQGLKYLPAGGTRGSPAGWVEEIPRRLKASASLYIDPQWEADEEPRRTGFWYALSNSDGVWTWFEIIEYRSSAVTGDEPTFLRFGSVEGYEEAGLPTRLETPAAANGGWVRTMLSIEPGGDSTEVAWKINGQTLFEDTFDNDFGDTDHFGDFFVNSINYGVDQDYYYDGFSVIIN
jgi:hypothetical protein